MTDPVEEYKFTIRKWEDDRIDLLVEWDKGNAESMDVTKASIAAAILLDFAEETLPSLVEVALENIDDIKKSRAENKRAKLKVVK